jgi:hypothetical protein
MILINLSDVYAKRTGMPRGELLANAGMASLATPEILHDLQSQNSMESDF